MAISIQDRTEFLNKLFIDKDLEFLNTYDSEIKNLEKKLELQKTKKKELSKKLESLKEHAIVSSDLESYKSSFIKINNALNYIDENIKFLSNSQTDFICLNKEVANFLLRFEKENDINILREDGNQIKLKINSLSKKFSEIQDSVFVNDIKTDNIIKQIKINHIKKEENKEVNVQEATQAEPKEDVNKLDDLKDNNVLLISEKNKTIHLPYTKSEIIRYYEKYPKEYRSYKDIIRKQFILPLSCFNRAPAIARFREGYALERDGEAKSVFEALKFGVDLMFKSNLYPAIIPACKTEDTLNKYIQCLDNDCLNQFDDFEIKFEVTPLKI